MSCQFCQGKATVFYTQIVNGVKKELSLCDSCAAEKGFGEPGHFLGGGKEGGSALEEIISQASGMAEAEAEGTKGTGGGGDRGRRPEVPGVRVHPGEVPEGRAAGLPEVLPSLRRGDPRPPPRDAQGLSPRRPCPGEAPGEH